MRDFDLSDEEIESGIFGGGDDGGVDAFYFFVNRTLIQDETDIPSPAISVHLVVIQAKYERGFQETAIQKMESFARDLLDYSTEPNKLIHLNSLARDAISRFRNGYDKVVGTPHSISVTFQYATKSDQSPNQKVILRGQKLRKFILEQLSAADVNIEFWGCSKLLSVARSSPHQHLAIEISRHFTTDDGAVVCLVNLKSYKSFLTADTGELRTNVLEPNVRDYQGKWNPVNLDIRSTLSSADVKEFWWLNNGITVLAASCDIAGNKLKIERPEIVNGLQTSHELFTYFKDHPDAAEQRNVLMRVIVPPDEPTRGKIIKATNFQTLVDPVSLHANEQIHFDIEDKLKLYSLYYDRRKGQYRRLRKPISQIVSIRALARTVIAALLRQPDQARARPTTMMRNDRTYVKIFGERLNRDMYVATILLDRQVERFLADDTSLRSDEKRNVRFHILDGACRNPAKKCPSNT